MEHQAQSTVRAHQRASSGPMRWFPLTLLIGMGSLLGLAAVPEAVPRRGDVGRAVASPVPIEPSRSLPRRAVLPVGFEPNVGQADGDAKFIGRMGAHLLRLLPDRLELLPSDPGGLPLALTFPASSREVRLVGEDPLPGRVQYRIGAPEGWRRNAVQGGRRDQLDDARGAAGS